MTLGFKDFAIVPKLNVKAGDVITAVNGTKTLSVKDIAQLEAAIAYLQKKIAEDPRPVPKAPPYPKKVMKEIP